MSQRLLRCEEIKVSGPVVVLDTKVAREVYGEAAIYAAPGNLENIADSIIRGLNNPPLTADDVLDRYSWTHTADLTLDVIESAAHERT